MTVTDLISVEDIKSWNKGDMITISAGTGSGKSHFIKNKLYEYAKENDLQILMLIHRKNCVDQFQMELESQERTDHLTVKTYQFLEALSRNKTVYDLGKYDYIVADEAHYMFSDSAFNHFTDISLKLIMEDNSTKIFMSATGNKIFEYIRSEKHLNIKTIDYYLPSDYSNIKKLNFFYRNDTIVELLDMVMKSKKKGIFFIQSSEEAYKLHKRYPDRTIFSCSEGNKRYRYVDEDKIKSLLQNEKFDEQVLITTSVFEAGINITDRDVGTIVIDMESIDTVIQCVGRKRFIDNDDRLVVNIKAKSKSSLNGRISTLQNNIIIPLELYKNGDKSMVEKHSRTLNKSDMIYPVLNDLNGIEIKLNEMMFFRSVSDVVETRKILNIDKPNPYCDHVSMLLNKRYSIIEEENKKMEIENYLELIKGDKLMKDDQKRLIEFFGLRDYRNRLQKSISILNVYLSSNEIPYTIVSKRLNEWYDGKRIKTTYWEVIGDVESR